MATFLPGLPSFFVWMLRPFVGSPGEPVQFFRDDTWGNAYVIVVGKLWDALTH